MGFFKRLFGGDKEKEIVIPIATEKKKEVPVRPAAKPQEDKKAVTPGQWKSLIQALSFKAQGLEMINQQKFEAMQKIERLGKSALNPLLEALDSSDEEARGTIIRLLGKLKDKRAILPIARQLNHHSAKIRCYAIGTLQEYPIEDIISAKITNYVEQAVNDEDIDVRNRAGELLGKLGAPAPQVPWHHGAHSFEELARAFIRLELDKPSPDYKGFAEQIQELSAAERHGAWCWVAGKVTDKPNAMRCYLEALYNDPDPDSIGWGWLDGQRDKEMKILSPDSPKNQETIKKLRSEYGSILDQ